MNKNKIYIGSMALLLSFPAFGQQKMDAANDTVSSAFKKISLNARQTDAVSTVYADQIGKNSTPNPANALFGVLPGLTVMQQTGWLDNPTFVVRGRGSLNGASPLIIVDGFPRAIETLNVEEIESVSVLKDGAATAVWGTRGANGVISITTKRGVEGKMKIGVNYQFGMGLPINQPKFADAYTYALARNEALTNDGLLDQRYSNPELFLGGGNPNLYSNTDWLGEGLRSNSTSNQLEVTFRGGSQRVRYYSMLSYKNDFGILNNAYAKDYTERYNAQMKKYNLNFRINLDIDATESTKVKLSMLGMLYERKRPSTEENVIFSSLYNTPSAAFPVKTSSGIWGGNNILKQNPIAQIADVGFYREDERLLQSDLRITQDLSILTEGLSAELAIAYDNSATYLEKGLKEYQYEMNTSVLNPETGLYDIVSQRYGQDGALQITNGGFKDQYLRANLEAKLGYNRTFGKHGVSISALYRQEALTNTGAAKSRFRQYITGTAGYNYDNRYMLDVVVNRTGSSVLLKGDRYRTYPAVSAGWMISNESFMKSVAAIDFLKVRASFGRSGWDGFDYYLDRQYWKGGGTFFSTPTIGGGGLTESTLAMKQLGCEIADKYDVGLDLKLFKKLTLTADWFMDKRRDILVSGSNMVSSVIGNDVAQAFLGAVDTKGGEIALNWNDRIGDFKYNIGANLSYAASKVIENGEGYMPYSYLSAKGYPIGQMFGLEAIGYFKDDQDIEKSYPQMFSDVRPGDIKYKDQNGDKVIDADDRVAIGHSSSIPKTYYGINLSLEYKGFGVDLLFQGAGGYSKMLNTASVYWPLRNNSNISMWYLEDQVRWTEATKETATVPRLTTQNVANNFQNSTQWLVDGSFFKLRNVNVYYNFPKRWTQSAHIEKLQLFARANNLFSVDNVKYLNVEDFSVNYPDMTSVYFGVSVNF